MTEKTYNGWTNYATWRVALEFFDGFDCDGFEYTAGALEDMVIETLESQAEPEGVTLSYAMAFINDVNWFEIAEHLKEEAA
jgi:hypothetical protein